MEYMGIKNLRSLHETPLLPITPIVFLVGRNSSGKSTFLRSLPLLRQSLEQKTKGPLLWYGPYVDFGSFGDSISRVADSNTISFRFSMTVSPGAFRRASRLFSRSYFFGMGMPAVHEPIPVDLTFVIASPKTGTTSISEIYLKILGNRVELRIDPHSKKSRIIVNDQPVLPDSTIFSESTQFGLLPRLYVTSDVQSERYMPPRLALVEKLLLNAASHVSSFTHGHTSDETHLAIASQVPISSREAFKENLLAIKSAPKSWQQQITKTDVESEQFRRLCNACIAARVPTLIDIANEYFGQYFSSVQYLKPLRATAERYYRQQDLAVEEIDSQGANIPMYLDSLSTEARSDLAEWLTKFFHFSVKSYRSEGHIALRVREEPHDWESNLADMGFGYSQILPLAVQLWDVARRSRRTTRRHVLELNVPTTIAVEQPELHLHPQLQARVADAFASVVSSRGGGSTKREPNVNLLVETHSRQIINRVGHLVARGNLNASDVTILLFDRDEFAGSTDVRIATFDAEGVLQDWPFGFFEATPRES